MCSSDLDEPVVNVDEGNVEPEKKENKVEAINNDMLVIVNGKPVTLRNKQNYTYVDILDFYPFDTRNPKGNNLITKINGEIATFTDTVSSGDMIDLYWE